MRRVLGGRMNVVSDRLNSPAMPASEVVETFRLEDDGQRIAGKSFAGKHIVDGKFSLAHGRSSCPVHMKTGNMAEI